MIVPPPNYTQVPNVLFDLMPDMEKSELKVVMAVCRMTVGWHKTKDRLTVTRLMDLTGLSRQAVYDGIEFAKVRGILIQEETKQEGFIYSLDIRDEVSNEETPNIQPLDTQKKEIKVQEEEAAPAENVYSLYQKTFGDLIANPQGTKNQIYIEHLKEMPLDWVRESFARTLKKERATGEVWRDYRRLPYALQIAGDWQKAGCILPEQAPPKPPTPSVYDQRRAKPPAPAGPMPPDEKERQLREWVAARVKAGMDVPAHLQHLRGAAP